MKYLFTAWLIFLFSFDLISQNSPEVPDYFQASDSLNNPVGNQSSFLFNNQKIKTSIEIGTTIGSFKGSGACFNTYVSPFVSYKVNSRFSLDVGFTFSQGNLINSFNPFYREIIFPYSCMMNEKLLFTRGKYLLNDKLTVYGTAAYGIRKFKPLSCNLISDYQIKEFSFGAEYKLTETSRIGIEIRHIEGSNYFPYSKNLFTPARSSGIQ
jgi:long-subunit fatty acid transport protein